MAVMKEYAPGAPCWFELGTTDQAAAKRFYGALFGWSALDNPMGPGETYTMFQLPEGDTGAVYTLPPALRAQGVPPHWGVYFAAADVDASAAKVAALGGSMVQPPFDVGDAGRMAICKDPGGAVFSLWQPKRQPRPGVFAENNAVCWTELATWDAPQASAFYTGLFGWETKGAANMPTYIEFSAGGRPCGGLLPMDEAWKGMPSHWTIYIQVADCDAVLAKAKELGGGLRWGPHDAPGVGRFAALTDPQGAAFMVITLRRA